MGEALESDILFGRLAVEQGLARAEHVEECLASLRKLAAEGVAPLPRLADLLTRRGYLSTARGDATVRAPSRPPEGPAPARDATLPPEVAAAAQDPANVLGKYVRVSRLGAGGMGEVWRAWDRELRRPVALKFLRGQDAAEVARFEREAQTAARLVHPNIAAVHDVGRQDGRPFLAMQLVDGQTFASYPRHDRMALAALIREAAAAVHFAHGRGVVHRDLKPANLMVDGEGRVYVMDFGLAKQSAVDSSLSVAGSILGTPAYMPPEQARGELPRIDARSDVYSLGATLYELLGGRPPFVEKDVYALLKRVVEEDPVPLRRLAPAVDADLETIVHKCLEKDPERRYAGAQDLADELGRWLAGDAILAHPPSTAYRVRKFVARRKAVFATAALAAAVALGFGGWAVRSVSRRDRAAKLLEVGRPALDRAIRTLYDRNANYDELLRRVEEGRARFEEALAMAPDLAPAHFLDARAWDLLGWADRAERGYRKAIGLDPDFGPARYHLGRLLLERSLQAQMGYEGRHRERRRKEAERLAGEAAAELEAARGRSGFDDAVQADVAAALLAYARTKGEEMRRLAEEGLGKHGHCEGTEDFHVLLGLVSEGSAREEAYTRALQIRPHHAFALFLLANARQGDAAIADLTAALRTNPRFAMALNNRATVRAGLGDRKGALADFSEALRISPRDPTSLVSRGDVRMEMGDLDGAIADANEALKAEPGFAPALAVRGGARRRKGELDAARADLEEALRIEPRNPEFLNTRSSIRRAQEDYPGAAADLKAALEIRPDFPEALVNRGSLKQFADLPDEALADYEKALKLDPRLVSAHVNLGSLFLDRGQADRAVVELDEALRLDPRNFEARYNRSLARQQKGDLDGSIADATEALKLKPGDAETLFTRGNAWESKPDLPKALADYDAALAANPRYVEAYCNRAMVRARRQEIDAAIGDLEKALALAPQDWPQRAAVAANLKRLKALQKKP
jgi:serine/threonine-protein kinase